MKRKIITLPLLAIVILVIFIGGYKFGKPYYIQANLYKPSVERDQNEHRYLVEKDRFGTNVTVFLPKTYQEDKHNKWVLFAHGSNGSSLDLIKLSGENSLLKPLLDNGYVVIAPNYRNVINWGNEQGVEDLVAAYHLGNERYNLENKPYLIMQSMGGLIGLNSIAKELIEPKAVVGIYPVTNLKFAYGHQISSIPKYIEQAYGITDVTEFEAKTKGYDPTTEGREKYKDIPMLFIASYADKVVPRKPNTDTFMELVNNEGGYVKVLEHTGNHGDISAFKFDEVVSFFNEH